MGLTERGLDDTNLRRRSVQARKRTPIVHDHARADDFGSAIDGSCDEGDLEQGGELVELGSGGSGVDEAALMVTILA